MLHSAIRCSTNKVNGSIESYEVHVYFPVESTISGMANIVVKHRIRMLTLLEAFLHCLSFMNATFRKC